MRVNFVVGGTQKGGTSALDSFLRQHPEICMPKTTKEVHFFDREEIFASRPDYKKYHAHFRPESTHKAIGEASPIYMYWNPAPYRIWSYNPAMKWILILRNPAERAHSAWNMEKQRGLEDLSFPEAITRESIRCRKALPLQHRIFSYVDRGFYASQVRRLFNIFGRDQCLILLNEDLESEHESSLRKVFRFLNVDDSINPPDARVFAHPYDSRIEPKLHRKLIETFYFDIKELEQLLGREMPSWYQGYSQ
jgi:hypothetical protein